EGVRIPRRLYQRRGLGPGFRNFLVAAHRRLRPAAGVDIFILPGCCGTGHGGARPCRGQAAAETGRPPPPPRAGRRSFYDPGPPAVRLVLRVAGAVPVFLPGRRRDLSYLRCELALFRALASDRVRSTADLRPLHSHSHDGICVASPTQGGGAPCRRRRRLRSRSTLGAISRASASGAASTRRGSRSASISRPRTAATSCARLAPAPTSSSSRPPT